MTASEVLSTLRRLNVRIRVENGQLRCNGPQGVITADLREALSAHKAAIVAELEKLTAPLNQRETPIQRVPRDRSLPLSFAQQRLWFLDQFEPGNSVYNVPKAFRVRGPFNIARI